MSGPLLNLLLQLIGGAIGGNAAGGVLKNNLGAATNSVAGAVGGVAGTSILGALIPAMAGGTTDFGSIASQLVGGGATGAIVAAIVGMVMAQMKK